MWEGEISLCLILILSLKHIEYLKKNTIYVKIINFTDCSNEIVVDLLSLLFIIGIDIDEGGEVNTLTRTRLSDLFEKEKTKRKLKES